MQDTLLQLISLPTLIFCLMIFGLVWVQRKGMELLFVKLKESKGWNEFWIPVGPLGTGAIVASLFKQYPYPEMFVNVVWYDRAAFGIACGMFSGLVYKLIKKNIMDKISGTNSTQPPTSENPPQV